MNSKPYFMMAYRKYLQSLNIPASTDYARTPALRPKSIVIDGRRYSIESQADYIARLAEHDRQQPAKPKRRRYPRRATSTLGSSEQTAMAAAE